jgi:hypothetical protein
MARCVALAGFAATGFALITACRGQSTSPALKAGAADVTFNRDVAPILQNRCQSCHHEGGIAPFALMSFEEASKKKQELLRATTLRLMPPWKASRECVIFDYDPALSREEIATLARWVHSGAPRGDPKDLPPARSFPDGWALGKPDLTLEMAEPYKPDFSRGDIYRCFVLPVSMAEDRYVGAVDFSPGNRPMVHHALLFIEDGTSSKALEKKDGQPGYTCFGGVQVAAKDGLGGWAPGHEPSYFPPGTGKLLPKDARVIAQIHYSARSGPINADSSRIAFYFTKPPIEKRIMADAMAIGGFTIPAGNPHYALSKTMTLQSSVHLVSILPHMHLIGRSMRVTATLPDGTTHCLVDVTDWDFRWQRTYIYKELLALPRGTRVTMTGVYNNSTGNPRNPNSPPRDVHDGENTTDEMCLVLFDWIFDGQTLAEAAKAKSHPGFCGKPAP